MKRGSWWVCVAAVAIAAGACKQQGQGQGEGQAQKPAGESGTPSKPATDEQKTLYALGMSVGRQVAQFDLSREELEYVKAGLEAQVLGTEAAVEMQTYGPKLSEMARNRSQARAAKEKEKSQAFLEKAKQESGVTALPSGILIKIEKEGQGASPTDKDTVKVHYKGTLINGKEFDSSYSRNEPATFPLGGVVPCWREGLQKLKVGAKARIICPSDLAYGDRGAGPMIPGGAALIFDVELMEILPQDQNPMGALPGQPGAVRPGQPPPIPRPGQPPPGARPAQPPPPAPK
jgi:FKBP-type peptidyl-prolyl cis-trans isomerase FkpA